MTRTQIARVLSPKVRFIWFAPFATSADRTGILWVNWIELA